jgi:acyl-CoA synthetase (NDP forming)
MKKFLPEHLSKELLEKYGIRTAKCIFAESEDEVLKAAKKIGFPLVMKVVSEKIIHKSRVNGVLLNLKDEDEVLDGYRKLMKIPDAEGVNLQPMLERGIEVVIGITKDENFERVLMFGLGGVFVEELNDVSFRLIPINRCDAEEMINEIMGYRILKKIGIQSIVTLLTKISDIAERENIVEMDLNPVFVYEGDYAVADARMWILESLN